MNSRERMLTAINHEPLDRVLTDIWATPEVWERLKNYFGNEARICAALHIDGMASAEPKYVGPKFPSVGKNETADYWGIRTRKISYSIGFHNEIIYNPLGDAETIRELEEYKWPSVEWFDFSGMKKLL